MSSDPGEECWDAERGSGWLAAVSWLARARRRLGDGSKRDALILLPGSVLPSAASFVGLVLVIRLAGVTVGGLLSLCRVTATFGGAILSEGPSLTALRLLSSTGEGHVPPVRGALLRRALVLCPTVAAVGWALDAFSLGAGLAILAAAPLIVIEALTNFEADTLRYRRDFVRSSGLSSLRPLLAWAGAILAALLWGSFTSVAAFFLAGEVAALALLGSFRVAPLADVARRELRQTWGPVARSNIAGYALNNGDQYVVAALLGTAAVGRYAVGYQLGGGLIGLLAGPVAGAMGPRIVDEWHDPAFGPALATASARRTALAISATTVAVLPVLVAIDLTGAGKLILRSSSLIPVACIVAIATGIHTVASVAYSPILLASGRIRAISRCSWATTLLGIVLVPALTAEWGLVGAAVATLLTYVFMAALINRAAVKAVESAA